MKKTFNLKGYALASIAAAVLAACGGGGGSSSTPAAAGAAVTVPLPAAPVGTPADADTTGTLPTLAFVSALSSSTVNATIDASVTPSVMTFATPAFTITGANSATTTFAPKGGLTRAGGNVVLYCDAGMTVSTGDNTADLVSQKGGNVFISANLVAVTDAKVLAGKTIKTEDCAGVTVSTTYNADGTSTRVDSSGTKTLNVTESAAFVSAAGFTGPGGGNYKTRIYQFGSGATVRYFVVTLINQVNPTGTFVNVGYQVP